MCFFATFSRFIHEKFPRKLFHRNINCESRNAYRRLAIGNSRIKGEPSNDFSASFPYITGRLSRMSRFKRRKESNSHLIINQLKCDYAPKEVASVEIINHLALHHRRLLFRRRELCSEQSALVWH